LNININDIKNGMTILLDGNLCSIVEFQHVKPGKGSAFVRMKLKNLRTGAVVENTYNTNIKITKVYVSKIHASFLYANGENYVFMNTETYEQTEIPKKVLTEALPYIKEGMEVEIENYEGEILGVNLPEKVEYTITSTEPAVKGNTTNNAQKDAIIETGYTVKVPLFINEGEKIIISTKDGKYVGRA
jgi:elongation factor P